MLKRFRLFAMFANAAALSGGEWEKIAPYGEHPSADRKRVQVFGKQEAAAMVATFNSALADTAAGFKGVPIFHGHPDIDRNAWPDDRRLGRVVALEARADGLYGRPEYNELGQQNKDEGWWVYPSPTWLSNPPVKGIVRPDELMSIGLVNTPNITGSQPWTNSLDPSDEDTSDTTMDPKLLALLNLQEGATPEEVFAAVQALKTAAGEKEAAEAKTTEAQTATATANSSLSVVRAELTTARADLTSAATSLATLRKNCAEVIANSAVTAGKITEAERVATVNSLSAEGADLVALAKGVFDKTTELNSTHLSLGGRKVAISNAKERASVIQAEVNSRMQKEGIKYQEAYKRVKEDPEFAPIFAAMATKGTEDAA